MSKTVIDHLAIQTILPHRYPFLLVDQVTELQIDEMAIGIKNVTINEPFFQGHFPGRPIFPGVLILEAFAQLGGILAISSVPGGGDAPPVVYLTGIDKTRFRKPVIPGDQLRLHVTVLKKRPPYWKMEGKAFVGDELVCEAESTAMVTTTSEKGRH